MSVGILFGKRTWIGVGAAISTLLLMVLLGSLLIVREILPMEAVSPWLWLSYGLAAFVGGCLAAVGQRRKVCAFVPGTMVYVLAWLLALCSECRIDFASNGIGITIAVGIGMLAAFMGYRGKKKRRYNRSVKRPAAKALRR